MNTPHACETPSTPPEGRTRDWECPVCFSRWLWERRMLSGQMSEGYRRLPDSIEVRSKRSAAEFRRSSRRILIGGAVAAVFAVLIVLVGLWITFR